MNSGCMESESDPGHCGIQSTKDKTENWRRLLGVQRKAYLFALGAKKGCSTWMADIVHNCHIALNKACQFHPVQLLATLR